VAITALLTRARVCARVDVCVLCVCVCLSVKDPSRNGGIKKKKRKEKFSKRERERQSEKEDYDKVSSARLIPDTNSHAHARNLYTVLLLLLYERSHKNLPV
jgi:hypothetical protein